MEPMKIETSLVVLLLGAAVVSGCNNSTEHRRFPTEATLVSLEQEFILQQGQVASIPPGTFSIRFDSVGADSRCPTDVVCVWDGDAAVHLTVLKSTGERQVVVHSSLEPKSFTEGSVRVSLLKVTPENLSTRAIPQGEYRVTFIAN